jgi:cellulose synthase/poly-beta-1,6-N-acetylglucosamine synthase-like glycosyltransferase
MIEFANSPLWFGAVVGLTAAFAVAGCVAASFGLYPLVLSIAALFYSESPRSLSPRTRLVVLVPAHDESALIGRCVRSLREQTYPSELYEVVVIADNCTDRTAAIAAEVGADEVMTREAQGLRGKGQALRWALDRILARESPPAAVVVVDADSIATPDLLVGLVAQFEAGARAVQGTYLLSAACPGKLSLGVIPVLLMNWVRPAGFSVFHLPFTQLVGNGMLLAREVLLENPWTAFTNTEDLEYSLMLQTAGERIAFAGNAVVHGSTAPNAEAAAQQQLRWHGGKFALAKLWLPRLIGCAIRERRFSLLGVAFGLAVPPLGVLMAGVIVGAGLGGAFTSLGLIPMWSLVPWLLAVVSIPLSVIIGLRAAGAPVSGYTALIHAPLYVVRMALRARRVATFGNEKWVRTERDSVSQGVGPRF